ncbi:acyltransferase domain-containing protein, partial [Richelia intracellularis]|uniref:acyltransferase domain-containing protein n=1 Tax=Richelia intracellularis TaxID=1164990 RepID=UPI0005C6B599
FKADFVAGHSFGELTALWAAEVLTDEDYCFLVKSRGQAMAAPQYPNYDTGTMLAVKSELEIIEAILKQFPKVAIANLNSPTQVVLAGPTADIHKLKDLLHQQGSNAVLLPVAAAFHTPLIAFAEKSFAIAIKNVEFQIPKVPVYTNVTAKEYPQTSSEIQKILETHISNPVLFKQEIENIYDAGGYCFIEFGPRKILTNLVKDILGERPHLAIALNPSDKKNSDHLLRQAVLQLRVVGLSLQNLDPYYIPKLLPETETKKGLKFQLNGMNYVSDKTKQGFAQALQNIDQVDHIQSTKSSNYTQTVRKNSNGRLNVEILNPDLELKEIVPMGEFSSSSIGFQTNGSVKVEGKKSVPIISSEEKLGKVEVSAKANNIQEKSKANITSDDSEITSSSQIPTSVSHASLLPNSQSNMQNQHKI